MKFKILILVAAVLLCAGITGCYKDIINPGSDPNGPPQQVSFSGDLLPLFVTNCATSGCHDGTAHAPALTAPLAYNAIVNGGYVNTTVPTSSIIHSVIKSGSMPPSGALKPSDTQKILDWIRNGAPNN